MSPFSHTLALLIITLSFYFISLQLGTDAMASKSKQKEIVKKRQHITLEIVLIIELLNFGKYANKKNIFPFV